MTQIRSTGFRYIGIDPNTGVGLQKISSKLGGEVIEITAWEGNNGKSIRLANNIIAELLADLGNMLEIPEAY